MSKEQEQRLRELLTIAGKLPENKCEVLVGVAKGMEISASITSARSA